MKLTQFWKDSRPALGLLTGEGTVDVSAEAARRGISAPATALEAVQGGQGARAVLEELSRNARCFVPAGAPAAPVITGMDKVLCIGLNYRRHAMECNLPIPERPVLFNKFPSTLSACGDTILLQKGYVEYDYEAELVVVMGREARHVSEAEAMDYIYGYTCGNDVSTRDLQFARGNQWVLSKSLEGFGPIGPCLVTGDALDGSHLDISCAVNGEVRQNSNTSDLIFSIPQLIADLSRHFTLLPGDLIFTGTPAGVMHGYTGEKHWLKAGDRVEVTIQGIGTLWNTFAEEQ